MNTYFLADAITSGAAGFSAVLILVLFGIGLILAICWIAFPFIVIFKFNDLLKLTLKQSANQNVHHAEQIQALVGLKTALNETNKALQYLVDNAGPDRERV